MGLWDSVRAYKFTFYLQVIGIILTVVSNLWNASMDKTFIAWAKKKCPECFDYDETWWSATTACCAKCCKSKAGGSGGGGGSSDDVEAGSESESMAQYPPQGD